VGAVRPGIELQVVDEAGRAVPAGTVGEVRIRVADMPSGYLDDPAGTARGFRDGWFHPGDLALLSPEGMLYLKGRTDDLINYQGVKILPAEIEEVLLAHPNVAEAAAYAVQTERDNEMPGAAVVLRGERDVESLTRWCTERLRGSRTPRVLLVLKSLPRNAAGKVMRTKLAEMARKQLDKAQ
jgi:long-chain acyl-CoA synthetase